MALERTPDMEGLSPAERAAIYKARARGAGIGGPPQPAAGAPAGAPAEAAPPPGGGAGGNAPPAPAPEAAEAAAPAAAAAPAPAPAAPPAAPARPAAPAPPPAPKEPEVPIFVKHLQEVLPEATWQWRHGYAEMKVPRERLLDAARLLRGEGFDFLSFITEVDWKDRFELLYHLFSYDFEAQPLGAILRTELPREDLPEVASLTAVWPGAEWMERECFEMLGIRFLGHPDLRRILLPDDFKGYPLRKDYETDFDYITVKQLVRELDPDTRGAP
jgi:NADH-quinone oxidoreductase subunit C